VANTKVQRWAVLIAEFGAPINYYSGKKNFRADFLSRIQPTEVDVIDTVPDVEPQMDYVTWSLPLKYDGINQDELAAQQLVDFRAQFQQAADDDDEDYEVRDNILFSLRRPGAKQARYPRVMLPPRWQDDVIKRCHDQTGHAGVWRTLCAIRESYVFPGMQKKVKDFIKRCGLCELYKAKPTATPFTRMPEPQYPWQYCGMDLTGPFMRSPRGHMWTLNIIDHLTGSVECYPIGNKRGETIADILQREFLPRYGAPECIITDRGTEMVNPAVRGVMEAADIDHRTSTPYRPQTNSKIERFHATYKGIMERLMAQHHSDWETALGPTLAAYRSTATIATETSPYQRLFGRAMRYPLTRALQTHPERADDVNDDRVANMILGWQQAKHALRAEREANEQQQKKKRLSGKLWPGDNVLLLKPGYKKTFHPRWDARWMIMRAKHPVYWVHHLPTGLQKVVHRDKLHYLQPNVDWSMLPDQAADDNARQPLQMQPMDDGDLEPAPAAIPANDTATPAASPTTDHAQPRPHRDASDDTARPPQQWPAIALQQPAVTGGTTPPHRSVPHTPQQQWPHTEDQQRMVTDEATPPHRSVTQPPPPQRPVTDNAPPSHRPATQQLRQQGPPRDTELSAKAVPTLPLPADDSVRQSITMPAANPDQDRQPPVDRSVDTDSGHASSLQPAVPTYSDYREQTRGSDTDDDPLQLATPRDQPDSSDTDSYTSAPTSPTSPRPHPRKGAHSTSTAQLPSKLRALQLSETRRSRYPSRKRQPPAYLQEYQTPPDTRRQRHSPTNK